MTLTKNTDKLRREVAAHVAADTIVQGTYWDDNLKRGCFIGCLAKNNNPAFNEAEYGLPVMLQRIAENIFETLESSEAKALFAALPDAVDCDGKDLSKVSWQFLAAELRSLPPQPSSIQQVINPVIAGMDLLAANQDWPYAEAAAATDAAADIYANAAASSAADAAYSAATSAADAGDYYWPCADAEAAAAAHAAFATNAAATAHATFAEAAAAESGAYAATSAATFAATDHSARLRQRDLLLKLIKEAPVQ